MIQMAEEKFFYKYQSFEKVKDKNGNDRQYVVENLVNNCFYLQVSYLLTIQLNYQ
jgi:hypothetical protein